MRKALVVVDYQNDFVNGALGFTGAEKLEDGIVAAVESALAEGTRVLFTRDTHEEDYLATREGRHLPIAHCISGQPGHQLYGRLHRYEEHLVPGTALVDKPGFGYLELGKKIAGLCGGQPDVVELCGLVTDICVVSNAIILLAALPGTAIRVRAGLCGSGNEKAAACALEVMRGMGIEIVE